MVLQRSSTMAMFSATRSPLMILSMVSTPRVEPIRHGAHRAATGGASANIVDQFAKRDAESRFEQSAMADVAGELDRHRAARTAHAEIGIGFGAAGQDEGDRGKRQHVVDHGGPAEQA